MTAPAPTGSVRLGEILGALSLATDIGNGLAPEKSLRTALLAVEIGRDAGMAGADLSDLWYAGLLRHIGCTGYAHETASMIGDELEMYSRMARVDFGRPKTFMREVVKLREGDGFAQRARAVGAVLRGGKQAGLDAQAADCDTSLRLGKRLGMSDRVLRSLSHAFERWDGKGRLGLSQQDIDPHTRIVQVAHFAEVHHLVGGPLHAIEMIARGRGGWFDPEIADAFLRRAAELLAHVEADSVWDAALAAEPDPRPMVGPSRVDEICAAFADFVDLKSPWTLGHSTGVAALAVEAAARAGLDSDDTRTLSHASLLHDLGAVSVSSALWAREGPLSPPQWERVRLHAYQTERILAASELLRPVATVAGSHHERLDGSGYHRGAAAAAMSAGARLLAVADVFGALTEARPHRPAFTVEQAAEEVGAMAAHGLLDGKAVEAVCSAAGLQVKAIAPPPSGLTEREVEVARLLARGLTKRQIATELFIAPGTVHTHVTHIYGKIGVSSRAGVALFAMEHRLLD